GRRNRRGDRDRDPRVRDSPAVAASRGRVARPCREVRRHRGDRSVPLRPAPQGSSPEALTAMLADGGPLDQTSTLLAIGAVLVGLVAVQRLRERAFASIPRPAAYVAASGAVVLL